MLEYEVVKTFFGSASGSRVFSVIRHVSHDVLTPGCHSDPFALDMQVEVERQITAAKVEKSRMKHAEAHMCFFKASLRSTLT